MLEVITLTRGSAGKNKLAKRQGFDPFLPVLVTTSSWPAVVDTGVDGSETTTAPSGPFPTPPPSVAAVAVLKRNWQSELRLLNGPIVPYCCFFDIDCFDQPWLYGDNGTNISGDPDDPNYDENWEELLTVCPVPTSSISSITTTSSTTSTATTTRATAEYQSLSMRLMRVMKMYQFRLSM